MIGHETLRRMQVIVVLCTLPFAMVLVRVGWLQMIRGEDLNRRAESQHVRRVWIPPHPIAPIRATLDAIRQPTSRTQDHS